MSPRRSYNIRMEMEKEITVLVLAHFLFFWRTYFKPMDFARSELLSTFFPSWIWQGRQIRQFKSWKYDPYYWLNFHSHPVLSSYYPIHVLSAWVGSFLSLDNAFKLLLWSVRLHHLVTSIAWFLTLSYFYEPTIAIFGSFILTYNAFNIKQQPCLVYTVTQTSLLTLGIVSGNIFLSSLSFGSLLLAGYYPIGIQATLWALALTLLSQTSFVWVPIGLLVGSIQFIPFIKYLPKTIRTKKVGLLGILKVSDFLELLWPQRVSKHGVGYQELSFYMGLVAVLCLPFSTSRAIWIILLSALIMLGIGRKWLPRIPARFGFLLTIGLGWCATNGLSNMALTYHSLLALVFLTYFDLFWHNSTLDPHLPHSELPNRPKWAFQTALTTFLEANSKGFRISGLPYPLFTGHINRLQTLGYSGGMQLKLMSKWRQDNNPDGGGEHNYFQSHEDNELLDRYRVRFSYQGKGHDWLSTPVRGLWENPRLQGSPS